MAAGYTDSDGDSLSRTDRVTVIRTRIKVPWSWKWYGAVWSASGGRGHERVGIPRPLASVSNVIRNRRDQLLNRSESNRSKIAKLCASSWPAVSIEI
jgi:hypothetical protein